MRDEKRDEEQDETETKRLKKENQSRRLELQYACVPLVFCFARLAQPLHSPTRHSYSDFIATPSQFRHYGTTIALFHYALT